MGTLKPETELLYEIDEAAKKIKVGSTYQHYKSPRKLYRIEGFATLEATDGAVCDLQGIVWAQVYICPPC